MHISFRTLGSLIAVVTLVACSSGKPVPVYTAPPPSGAAVAGVILEPLIDWNPIPGQTSKPGAAAYGRVDINNGIVDTQQTFEAWTSAGSPMPNDMLRRQQRGRSSFDRHRRPVPKKCYDPYTGRWWYRC